MANDPPPNLVPVEFENRPWHSSNEYVSRTQRRLHAGMYAAALPARIANLELQLPATTLAESEDALREILRFDEFASSSLGTSAELAPMSSILLRTESAASSQIENLTVGARALAAAELGNPTNRNAVVVLGNVRAMEAALALSGTVDAESVLAMHRALMEPSNDAIAGRWRDQQVWIGGSDVGPHRATFVPPHHDRLPEAMADLFVYAARTDIPVLTHAAIVHAQFETIHPFDDGNGRTGRALIHSMLRGSAVTERSTLPLSAGLLMNTESYFASLGSFREGDAVPIVERLTVAAFGAVSNGRLLIDDLVRVREEFTDRIDARRDSVVWKIVDALIAQPVIDNAYVKRAFGVSDIAAQRAIDRLADANVLRQTSSGRRNRVWQADDILAVLDAFADRIRRSAR